MNLKLFLNQCIRSREVQLSLILILILGVVAIIIGNRHLSAQEKAIEEVDAYQKEHLERHVQLHNDDLGLLLYYVKFAHINPLNPLAGLSIGQSDINPSIKRITIKTFEAQKHDTDLINPMNLQSGNFDLSFVFIYLIPLLIIVLTFNLLSEETETGTWRLVAIQTSSKIGFIVAKLSIRLLLVLSVVIILFVVAVITLNLNMTIDFWILVAMVLAYILFWFAISFLLICLKKSSGFNALMLLSIWLVLLILLPAGINAIMASKYPVPEALTTAIAQRDGYHTKWDTEKLPTIRKFYDHYPQFEKYGYPTEGFNWLWYYAMQQMGDDDSKSERLALDQKIKLRETASSKIAALIPNMHLQLAFNNIAGTSLEKHIDFLNATEAYHEELRLFFYPHIFEEKFADTINWERFVPKIYDEDNRKSSFKVLFPIFMATLLVLFLAIPFARKI